MRKKIVLFISVVLSVFMMTGCNTEVALYYFPGSETSSYRLDFRFDNSELSLLNSSAQDDKNASVHSDYYLSDFRELGDSKWTVEQYLTALLKYKTDFTFTSSSVSDTTTIYVFYTANGVANEYDEIQTKATRVDESKVFFHYYNFEMQNPMTKFRNEYNNAATSGREITAIEVIQNGWSQRRTEADPDKQQELESDGWIKKESGSNEYMRKLMPAFSEAFPIAANKAIFNPDRLKLSYYMQSNSKLKTSGELLIDASQNKYYLFKELFANPDATIFYQMRRANSISWNILAIIIGFAVVGTIYLITKYRDTPKKPKKTNSIADFSDRLPYNPDSPFEGY